MIMPTEQDYLARKEYYRDQRRAADKYRLERVAMAGRERVDRFYTRAMLWLGSRLVAWGSRLEERYDTVFSAPMPRSANQAAGQ